MDNAKRQNVKAYLRRSYDIDQRINSKLEQVTMLRHMASQTTVTLSDMPRSSSPSLQAMQAIIAKMVDLEREITEDIDALVDLKVELTGLFRRVQSQQLQTLLEQRYLCLKTWAQIAAFMDCDEKHVFKLHKQAIIAVERLFEKVGVNAVV